MTLNWTDPTYVCTETGIKGVGGKGGMNSQLWNALEDLIGEIRDFPINWQGPGAPPVEGAPTQGTVYKDGNHDDIDKFDIIGFASLRIVDVLSVDETEGGVGTCATKNNSPVTWTADRPDTEPEHDHEWVQRVAGLPEQHSRSDHRRSGLDEGQEQRSGVLHTRRGLQLRPGDADDHLARHKSPKDTKVSFDWMIDPNNGPCGTLPS